MRENNSWQAESDARTLKEHAVITTDRSRHSAAKAHLKKENVAITKALKPNPMSKSKKK